MQQCYLRNELDLYSPVRNSWSRKLFVLESNALLWHKPSSAAAAEYALDGPAQLPLPDGEVLLDGAELSQVLVDGFSAIKVTSANGRSVVFKADRILATVWKAAVRSRVDNIRSIDSDLSAHDCSPSSMLLKDLPNSFQSSSSSIHSGNNRSFTQHSLPNSLPTSSYLHPSSHKNNPGSILNELGLSSASAASSSSYFPSHQHTHTRHDSNTHTHTTSQLGFITGTHARVCVCVRVCVLLATSN
jgi:hypothetical protein